MSIRRKHETGKILVVDDERVNRQSLRCLLELKGHEVREAGNGREALDVMTAWPPDLVILDVRMPEMDGFETCRRIRNDPTLSPIPVILLTGLRDRTSRLEGVEAGANDFLTKPPDEEELTLRVENAIFAKRLYDEVNAQYERLRELEEMRDNLTHMIVHDMRSPAAAAQGYLEMIEERLDSVREPFIRSAVPKARACVDRLLGMMNDVLDVSRMETACMPLDQRPADLREIVRSAVAMVNGARKNIAIRLDEPETAVMARVDRNIIGRVVTNVVSNAVKFTPAGGEVKLIVYAASDGAWVEVSDTGPGIPESLRGRIFDKFVRVRSGGHGRVPSCGLGLTFCKLAMDAHGGRIEVDSVEGRGSVFKLWFPAYE